MQSTVPPETFDEVESSSEDSTTPAIYAVTRATEVYPLLDSMGWIDGLAKATDDSTV